MKKPEGGRSRRATSIAVAALCLVQFVDVLGVTVVVTALPAMLAGLGVSSSATALVVTGYAMFFGGLLMLAAQLGDRYGHRRVLLVGVIGFGAASLLAAVAGSVQALVIARCLQGAAAALSVPTALRLLLETASGESARRRALAGWSGTGAAAGASGFLLGGALTDLAGWRAVFWVNVPLAAALVLAVFASAPPGRGYRGGRLDIAGAAALTAAVMAIVCGASLLERPSGRSAGVLVLCVGAVLVTALVLIERRAAHPLLPPAVVGDPRLRLGAAAAALNTATTSSLMTLATLYLQATRGVSPTAAGLLLLPCSLGVIAGSAGAAPLLRHRTPRACIALGWAAIAAGAAMLLAVPAAAWLLPAGVGICGAGLGLASVAANTLGTDISPTLQGTASGALNTAAQLGTALGVSIVLLVVASTQGSRVPLAGRPLGWACAATAALAGVIVLAVRSPRAASRAASEGRA